MSRKNRYEVLTLNAERLIFEANCKKKDIGGPEYSLDLSDKYIKRHQAVLSLEQRADNALFYQLRRCVEKKNNSIIEDDDLKCLYQYIIFVSFSTVFKQFKSIDTSWITKAIENGTDPYSTEDHLSHILNPSEGITITFEDGTTKRFVPFDKSANMARSCRISYVSEDIRDDLDEALRLGIDFQKLDMYLSKYFAYRGLYLTTGTRINLSDGFALNEKTVVVIDDTKVKPYGGNPLLFYDCSTDEERRQGKPHRFTVGNKEIEINAFDGEGLISQEFCRCINDQLFSESESASSFQIRMPFMKGMLHNVDFKKFVQSVGAIENAKIKDCFGIERTLDQVQIILTESMFKARGWLEEYWKNILLKPIDQENDPMSFFFEMMNKYDHGLYICGSNKSLRPNGFEKLNYQFIATMDMPSADFDQLIQKHFSYGEEKIKNIFCPESVGKARNTLIAAAVKNPLFYKEPRLMSQAEHEVRNLRINCGKGALISTGEHRFLSGDLFKFLVLLSRNAAKATLGKKYTGKYYKTLEYMETDYGTFYMPGCSFEKNSSDQYVILRSPHLSRNEQVLLSPRKMEENDVYSEYFGHLTGVIMLPAESMVQTIIGGADFDGDITKIYSDDCIVEAVRNGSYDQDAERTLPIVDIPNEDGYKTAYSDKEFIKLIINTFSSNTGLISNLALKFADKEYRYDLTYDYEEMLNPAESLCAYATAIAGCEIDSAKHGFHPVSDINYLQECEKNYPSTMQAFVDAKNVFKNLAGKRYKTEKIITKDEKTLAEIVSYNLIQYRRDAKKLQIRKPEKDSLNLLRLPYEFAIRDCAKDRTETDREAIKRLLPIPKGNASCRFRFERTEPEYATLGLKKKEKAHALVKAYLDVKKDISDYENSMERLQYTKAYKKLVTLLKVKYDSLDETRLPISQECIQDALYSSMSFAMDLLKDSTDVKDAIDRLVQANWTYAPKSERTNLLGHIMGTDPSSIPDVCIELLCDFTFDGFFILPYLLKAVMANRLLEQNPEGFLSKEELDKRQDKYGYYQLFVKGYKKVSKIVINDDLEEDENLDNEEEEDKLPDVDNWKKMLNRLAYEKLVDIAKETAPHASETRIREIIVEYAHEARGELDANGTFFWDVLPRNVILENILESEE